MSNWLRVLQRYFKGCHEILWLLETCPIVDPFLSYPGMNPYIGELCNKSYVDVLRCVEKDSKENWQPEVSNQYKHSKDADAFYTATKGLKKLWYGKEGTESGWRLIRQMGVAASTEAEMTPEKVIEEINHFIGRLLRSELAFVNYFVTQSGNEEEKNTSIKSFKRFSRLAVIMFGLLEDESSFLGGKSSFQDRYQAYLLNAFESRIADVLDKYKAKGKGKSKPIEDKDKESICFEVACMTLQHWKITTNASTASLLYQIPRAAREDFFDENNAQPGGTTK